MTDPGALPALLYDLTFLSWLLMCSQRSEPRSVRGHACPWEPRPRFWRWRHPGVAPAHISLTLTKSQVPFLELNRSNHLEHLSVQINNCFILYLIWVGLRPLPTEAPRHAVHLVKAAGTEQARWSIPRGTGAQVRCAC